jgi:hypothetical protein
MSDLPQPMLAPDGVPFCAEEKCSQYDGKRCMMTGFAPRGICEPYVLDMVAAIRIFKNDITSLRAHLANSKTVEQILVERAKEFEAQLATVTAERDEAIAADLRGIVSDLRGEVEYTNRTAEEEAGELATKLERAELERDSLRTALASMTAERDAAVSRANLEAAHHEHLRKERDAAIANIVTVNEAASRAYAEWQSRLSAEAERDAWRDGFICLECGRGAADEDGCCTTCGRDCLIFADGRLVNDTFANTIEAAIERDTAEAIAAWLETTASHEVTFDFRLLARLVRAGAWKQGAST